MNSLHCSLFNEMQVWEHYSYNLFGILVMTSVGKN